MSNQIYKSNDDKNIDLIRVKSSAHCTGCYYDGTTNCPSINNKHHLRCIEKRGVNKHRPELQLRHFVKAFES